VAASSASAPPATGRVSTGIPPLDTMLEGGLLAHRPYLVVGPSGTGKTTLALEFLCEGIRRGERCLLVTIEEPPNEARVNHRSIGSELDRVDVFDAIPDIMRYERVPFKDIAAVRSSQPFASVPLSIRLSPELSAVEVTLTALEQMLRSEVIRKGYSRLAIDSLTALQYFCMKGFDPVGGAQTFLRFLSDLRVTTILTVESPLEDLETPERALARGEIRLFRWEHENMTVRAIGVEKFRGSSHDVRLHPYRIGPHGIDINLEQTISRDTRQIVEPTPPVFAVEMPSPIPIEEVVSPVDPLGEEVRDLLLAGADVGPIRGEIEAALAAIAEDDFKRCREHITRASALAIALCGTIPHPPTEADGDAPEVRAAKERLAQRAEAARAGVAPTRLPPPKLLEIELERVLALYYPSEAPEGGPTPPAPVVVDAALESPAMAPTPEPAPSSIPETRVEVEAIESGGVPIPADVTPVPAVPQPAPESPPLRSEPSVPEVEAPPELAPAPPPTPPPVAPPRVPAGPSASSRRETESALRRVPSAPSTSRSVEARPRLPPSPPSGPALSAAPVSVPSRAVTPRTAPRSSGPPLPHLPAGPAPADGGRSVEVTGPDTAAAPKRRRKTAATGRRKPASAESVTPGSPASGTPPAEPIPAEGSESAKAKKRAPRKRKAPSVVAVRPAPPLGSAASTAESAAPTAKEEP